MASYNIHKGFSQFNRRMVVHELRERLRHLRPDIAFLQEVQGRHLRNERHYPDWPEQPQHQFLAEDVWQQAAYGRSALYDHGHHGNAVLSSFPIVSAQNQDISDSRLERRGLLHCEIQIPGLPIVHGICVHLSLRGRGRRRQMCDIAERIEACVPRNAPLIVAGDFNDWRNRADNLLAERLELTEVFGGRDGRPARTFPSNFPVLRLDRIYVRGFGVVSARVCFGPPWSSISDHAAIVAELVMEAR